jgi:hypothetical protein
MDEIGRMTLPQIACMASEKPPSAEKQIRSYAEYEAAIREEEARWSVDPS